MTIPAAFLRHAARNLPRYTSYPTALAFEPVAGGGVTRGALDALEPGAPLSIYVHVPFCDRLCWYCGCHTTLPNGYERVAAFVARALDEIDLWANATAAAGPVAHLHFGGGSPNALSPADLLRLVRRIKARFGLAPGAEIAAELDPGTLDDRFLDALGEAGATRASLGVQTFDGAVQAKVNRVQPFERVAAAAEGLRARGVAALNFDLMYGLPGQTPENVSDSARRAATLKPDRLAVFGYAHVPWAKKHQKMISEAELAGLEGRWLQADAADEALMAAGYARVGLDHYAAPDDPLARAAAEGRLRRNFQGYTDDPAPALLGIGPSAIGEAAGVMFQNAVRADHWADAVAAGRLPTAKALRRTPEDVVRAALIERLMCDLTVDVRMIAATYDAPPAMFAQAFAAARALAADGLCDIADARITIRPEARRLARVVAACFDARLPEVEARHAKAI